VFLVIALSSIGLPGLNGFVGEFLIMLGAFQRWPGATAVAVSGVVLAAVYMLWMYQRVMFGPLSNPENQALPDLSAREIAVFAPLLVLIVVMGVYPQPFQRRMEPAVARLLQRLEPALGASIAGRTAALEPERRAGGRPVVRTIGPDGSDAAAPGTSAGRARTGATTLLGKSAPAPGSAAP
jgi:NADH:ubiquinone oxidoreductase subunit 5 (subunit L)/multisubunit Na+/H+ antiporter MnhA subunit